MSRNFAPPVRERRASLFNHSVGIFERASKMVRDGEGVIAAILAVSAIEAMPYDLRAMLEFLSDHWDECPNNPACQRPGHAVLCSSPLGHQLSGVETKLLAEFGTEEFRKVRLPEKLGRIHALVGKPGWGVPGLADDLSVLIETRNEIVHPKSEYLEQAMKNGRTRGNIDGHPAVLKRLVDRKLIPRPDGRETWLNLLDHSPFGPWVLNVAGRVITETVDGLHDSMLMRAYKHFADLRPDHLIRDSVEPG